MGSGISYGWLSVSCKGWLKVGASECPGKCSWLEKRCPDNPASQARETVLWKGQMRPFESESLYRCELIGGHGRLWRIVNTSTEFRSLPEATTYLRGDLLISTSTSVYGVSCSPGWSPLHYVAEGNLEHLIFPPLYPSARIMGLYYLAWFYLMLGIYNHYQLSYTSLSPESDTLSASGVCLGHWGTQFPASSPVPRQNPRFSGAWCSHMGHG